MLAELQTILGGKPLQIDTTTQSSRLRPNAARQLPLFPPFKNASTRTVFRDASDTSRSPEQLQVQVSPTGGVGGLFRQPVVEALIPGFDGPFAPSKLFASTLIASGQRRQFVRFPNEPDELANGVLDAPSSLQFPRPPTVAPRSTLPPPITRSSTVAPSPAPALRLLGGLRLQGAGVRSADRLRQSLDNNGQLVTTRIYSSTRPTLDRARPSTQPSFITPPPPAVPGFGTNAAAAKASTGFDRTGSASYGDQGESDDLETQASILRRPGPGPVLTTGLRLHQVLTSTTPRSTPRSAVRVTTYNPSAHRSSFLAALTSGSDFATPASQSKPQPLPQAGGLRLRQTTPAPPSGGSSSLESPSALLGGGARDGERSVFSSQRTTSREEEEEKTRRSVMPQDLEGLCRSAADAGFCDSEQQYPRPYIARVVDQCSTILEYLYSEVPDDLAELSSAPDGARSPAGETPLTRANHREWSWAAYNYQHKDVCDATAHFVEPSYARATDGRWYVILQHEHLRQRVSVAMCNRLDGFCRTVSDCGKKSRCVQTFYHRTLIAADPERPTKCPRMRTFKLPGGCSCQVELAKSLRTLGS